MCMDTDTHSIDTHISSTNDNAVRYGDSGQHTETLKKPRRDVSVDVGVDGGASCSHQELESVAVRHGLGNMAYTMVGRCVDV
jgi:hypothetical protein